MYFPWMSTPSSHFHMCKEALKQSKSTTATTHTLSWHFFFLSSAVPALAEGTLLFLFQPAGQGYGGQKDENSSFLSLLTERTWCARK